MTRSPAGFTAKDLPDLTGKRAVVTGANSGIGLHAARALADHGQAVRAVPGHEHEAAGRRRPLLAGAEPAQFALQ